MKFFVGCSLVLAFALVTVHAEITTMPNTTTTSKTTATTTKTSTPTTTKTTTPTTPTTTKTTKTTTPTTTKTTTPTTTKTTTPTTTKTTKTTTPTTTKTTTPTTTKTTTPTTTKTTTPTTTKTTTPTTTKTTTPTTTKKTTITPTTPTTPKPSGTPRYSVTTKDGNVTCLLLESDITVSFSVKGYQKVESSPGWAAITDGKCGNDTDKLIIHWGGNDKKNRTSDFLLTLFFKKSKSDYSLSQVEMDYDIEYNETTSLKEHFNGSADKFNTDLGKAYNCTQGVDVKVDKLTVKMKNLRVQAFMNEPAKNPVFGKTGSDCYSKPSTTDAIVPIAVGAALAAMVLIVLIGYCIGRRRQNAGYQAMNA